jgi:NADH-quinone oxidoreductase subunit L
VSRFVVGRFVYDRIDQQVVDGAINGSAAAAESGGQLFRQLTSGRVQQYGALLFGAAAVFAGVFIIFV